MSEQIKSELEKIEIPAELHTRVKLGVEKAKQEKHPKPFKKVKIGAIAAASILAITLSSGFVHPSMNRVLASAPLLGGIYEKFGDTMGMHLAEQNLVTQLDKAITQNGVTVKLTNVYFDGDVVSITGNVTGELSKGHNEPGEVSFDVNFENNKGDHDPWLRGKSNGLQETEDGYEFQWKMNYPYKKIENNFTLPVTIHNINGIEGPWSFEVPLTQGESKTIALDHTQEYDLATIKMKEWKQSNASSSFTFETITKHKGDYIEFTRAEDENGNVLFEYGNVTSLARTEEEDGYHELFRRTIDPIREDTKAITFYPVIQISDPIVEQSLTESSFLLESERTDLAIKVNRVTHEGDKLILDYEFQGLADKMSNHKFEVIEHNLGYNFTLVDKDFVDKMDPDNWFPPKGHGITKNEVKVIDRDNYVFQSTFNLDGEEQRFEDFSVEDAVLRMDFNGYIQAEELAPFTVELK